MYSVIKSLLFKLAPEQAHSVALAALKLTPKWLFKQPTGQVVQAFGMNFPHPIGLAAGFDKNGECLNALAKLGFSFVELGTVTPKPQPGNPRPRLFRLAEADALINRMGFNNRGVDALVENVKKSSYQGIVGVNIGKNKETPLARAVDDYVYCLRKAYPVASYITINISSPNTPELRQLQQGSYFESLLAQLRAEQLKLSDQWHRWVPLVVKVSPDEEDETLKQMTEVILKWGVEGVIATNTTCSREKVNDHGVAKEPGGLSGAPLRPLSVRCIKLLKTHLGDEVSLIGVGGIDSLASAQEKLDAGAKLLQLYTGLIYQGPGLVSQLVNGLR